MIAPDFGWDYPPGTTPQHIIDHLGTDSPTTDCEWCGQLIEADGKVVCDDDQCWDDAFPALPPHCAACHVIAMEEDQRGVA